MDHRPPNKLLPHTTRLRANKFPQLLDYLNKIDENSHPTTDCPLCNSDRHDAKHIFNCPDIPTILVPEDMWVNPVGVPALLDAWGEKLGWPPSGRELRPGGEFSLGVGLSPQPLTINALMVEHEGTNAMLVT